MMTEPLLWGAAAVLLIIIMSAAWVVQLRTGQGAWIDALWTFGVGLAGLLVALWPLASGDIHFRQGAVAGLIVLWSLRLGGHLVERALKGAPDERYEGLKRHWGSKAQPRLFVFLMLQAAAGALLVVSLLVAARNPAPGPTPQDLLGVLVMLVAWAARRPPTGSWRSSRPIRPTRARSATLACGPGRAIRTTSSNGWAGAPGRSWPSISPVTGRGAGWPLTGPIYIYWLLTRVSGVPPLEAHMSKTRPEAFAAYAARTSVFFPRPPKKG
jgi:steroid 5-alpha reductase family enzyme